eukprot:9415007-Alexandrium_andersonii.AAC.1
MQPHSARAMQTLCPRGRRSHSAPGAMQPLHERGCKPLHPRGDATTLRGGDATTCLLYTSPSPRD